MGIAKIEKSILEISKSNDFTTDNFFQIPKDSYVYLKQLLKTANEFDDGHVRPFIVLIHALSKYNELKPDLVTLDITMPNKDGIQALKEIKAADPNATCVMCSAMGQQSMVIDAIQSGAKDFIVKPFQADRVLESIRKVLG